MVENGRNWLDMVGNGWKLVEMARDWWKWLVWKKVLELSVYG